MSCNEQNYATKEVVQMKNSAMLVGVAMITGFALTGCAYNGEQLVQSLHSNGNEIISVTEVSKAELGA